MTIRFKRICAGLYMNHEYSMSISHEAVWLKSEGRKWVAQWKVTDFPGFPPRKRESKFDTLREAREFLRQLIRGR